MTQRIAVKAISFDVEPDGQEKFWDNVTAGIWEPETFAIFDAHVTPETLMLDIGAWIGPTALYAAQLARQCIAFEPDPVAFAQLQRNTACNAGAAWIDRLSIRQMAIASHETSLKLGSQRRGGDSRSSALFADRRSSWDVQATTVQAVLDRHRSDPDQPVFLKLDIEGGEYDLVPHLAPLLAEAGVTAYISFHPKNLMKSLSHQKPAEYDWKTPFAARHKAVLDALPRSRNLHFTSPDLSSVEAVETLLRTEHRFPLELLIS